MRLHRPSSQLQGWYFGAARSGSQNHFSLLEIRESTPSPLPQQRAHCRRQSKKNTESNAQAPNTLHLVASQTIRARPDEIIYLSHISTDRRQEGFSAPAILGEDLAVEVGEGLADGDGDDDDGDEEGGVETSCDEEGEVAIPEEDVGDGAVEDCYAGLEVRVRKKLLFERRRER